nr:MAG TPA: hypothetical protein [Caudoviricetes sp.]
MFQKRWNRWGLTVERLRVRFPLAAPCDPIRIYWLDFVLSRAEMSLMLTQNPVST